MADNTERILSLAVMARDEATATLRKVDGTLEGLGIRAEGTGKAFLGLNASMANMAGAVAAGVAIAFLTESVKAAADEEAGITRLDAALKANVPSWNGNTKAIEASITARENLGFSDDALRTSLGSLVAVAPPFAGVLR